MASLDYDIHFVDDNDNEIVEMRNDWDMHCSDCGFQVRADSDDEAQMVHRSWKYCPGCGAKFGGDK